MPTPRYCHHKAKNLAYVTLDGRQVYLGPYDTPESHTAYYRAIAEYNARARAPQSAPLNITELVATYYATILTFDLSESNRTRIHTSIKLLRTFYPHTLAKEITPLHIKACREHWLTQKLTRQYINILTGNLVRMFRWAAEELYIPVDTYRALEIISPLKAGRTPARESSPDTPVSRAHVNAALPHCSTPIRALIELQWITGARPGELLPLRPADLDTTGPVWTYHLTHHKNAWRGKPRTIYFGPQAQAILKPFLLRPADSPCFSPRESFLELQARPTTQPRTPKSRPKPRKTSRTIRPTFDVPAYRRHIARACIAAGIDPWHPHQLRHAAATRFRQEQDLDCAQVLLGHDKADATQIYARITATKAQEAAARLC